jgi:hypothetical protein
MKDLSYLSMERLLEEQARREREAGEEVQPPFPESPPRQMQRQPDEEHWMTEEEIRYYKELIAETHHLALAQILKNRGYWIDKDGDESAAVFPHNDAPMFKRCIHGVKYGCDECWRMRHPNEWLRDEPGLLQRLTGVPEPPAAPPHPDWG